MRRTKKQLQAHKQYLKHRKERIAKQLKYNRAHAKKISIYMERYRIATKLIKTDVKKLMLDKLRRTKKKLQAHKQYLKHRKERIAWQLRYNRKHAKEYRTYQYRYRTATKYYKTDLKKIMLDKFRTWAGDKPQVQLKLMQQLESAPLRTEHGSGFAQLNRSITGTNRKHSIKLRMNLRTRRLEIWFHNSTEPYMED